MKALLFIGLLCCSGWLSAQDRTKDLTLLTKSVENADPKEKGAGGKSLYHFYQKHLSRQILNDCVYDHSCSRFAKDVFSNFGLLKGLFLTADRLTRCNRASFSEIPASHVNAEGKAIDHWEHYAEN